MKIQLKETSAYNYQLTNEAGAQMHAQATPKMSGNNENFRPMEMLLGGIASCSVIDLRLILEKQRQQIDDIQVAVEGLRDEQDVPSCFNAITLHYTLVGQIDPTKATKALELALFKYCSVQKHLSTLAKIDYTLTVNPK